MNIGFELNVYDMAALANEQHIDLINDYCMIRAYTDGWSLFHVNLKLFYIVPELSP